MRQSVQFWRGRRGATATELLVLLVLVAIVIMAAIKLLQEGLSDQAGKASDHVSSISTDSEDEDERRRKENMRRAEASGESGEDDGRGSSDSEDEEVAAPGEPKGPDPGGTDRVRYAESESGCGGFNPFLIPIALGLAGLIGYIVMKTKKG